MSEKEKTNKGNLKPVIGDAQQNKEQPVNNETKDANSLSANFISGEEKPELNNAKQEATNSETHNSALLTNDMEVHHHSHAGHGKKSWKSYFWEFLMLFLAVFCGFLAEYFLEHKIEKERGKQYIESFYADLRSDTSRLDSLINFETRKIAALNKLQGCYDSLQKNLQPASLLDIIKNSLANNRFLMDGRTLRQLNNAGGFRLLQAVDADSIISYEKAGNNLEEYQASLYQQSQDNVRNTFSEVAIFDSYTQLFSDITNNPLPDATEIKWPVILTSDKALLNKYFNQLFQYLRVIVQHRNRLKRINAKATSILLYFKNKYHFE